MNNQPIIIENVLADFIAVNKPIEKGFGNTDLVYIANVILNKTTNKDDIKVLLDIGYILKPIANTDNFIIKTKSAFAPVLADKDTVSTEEAPIKFFKGDTISISVKPYEYNYNKKSGVTLFLTGVMLIAKGETIEGEEPINDFGVSDTLKLLRGGK